MLVLHRSREAAEARLSRRGSRSAGATDLGMVQDGWAETDQGPTCRSAQVARLKKIAVAAGNETASGAKQAPQLAAVCMIRPDSAGDPGAEDAGADLVLAGTGLLEVESPEHVPPARDLLRRHPGQRPRSGRKTRTCGQSEEALGRATRSRQNPFGSIRMASGEPSSGGSGPGNSRRCSASSGGRRIRWRPSSVASIASCPAQRRGSKRSCESVPAGAAVRRTRSVSSSDRQNRTASSPRRSGFSRTLQPPVTARAVRQPHSVRLRGCLGRIGTIIGVAAQELPCPAARVEFRHVPICGRKPRYVELPHSDYESRTE